MADNQKKRKQASDAAPAAKRPRFPPKPSRMIPSTPTSTAYPTGEINVKSFLKSHETEIRTLENAMKVAKKGLSRRAFQDVPRELRRRTASHNPQRVPKRLRVRASQEAKEDNTPVSKGKSGSGVGKGKKKWLRKEGIEKSRKKWEGRAKRRREKKEEVIEPMEGVEGNNENLAIPSKQVAKPKTKPKTKPKCDKFPALRTPETPPSRFRRRQRDKTWLPTHVWHSKRARMTPPKESLWRFAIPLAPVLKAYRLTHRAASLRGAVAWDMSYMATIGLEGVEASVMGLLKGLHFAEEDEDDPWQETGKARKWRHGTRIWEGWIYERESKPAKSMAHVTVIWSIADPVSSKRKAFIRVHPCAFLQLWNEVIRIAKVQKPAVTVEDLRFEIGSIEIIGPAATETLCSILSPSASQDVPPDAPQSVWSSLATVIDTRQLPSGALLAFPISDPRLRDPPTTTKILQDSESQTRLMQLLANWPVDRSQSVPAVFDRKARLAARRALPSQKSINRRKAADALGGYPEPWPTDPQIPMLTYTSKSSRSWTVLLPWKCVLPVWRGIMRYPVSTGGNPRFGGLKERRQVGFERSFPCFPFDYPGTDSGWGWELQERVARMHDWTKRPKGKRIEWSTIDLGKGRKGEIGDPWACEWERLLPKPRKTAAENDKGVEHMNSPFRWIPSGDASELVAGRAVPPDYVSLPHLFVVKISMVQRGTPTNCARIYRLPTKDTELRSTWLSLMAKPKSTVSRNDRSKNTQRRAGTDVTEKFRHMQLAKSLLEPLPSRDGPARAGDEDYPLVPDEEDLIGFVTTGNYNLAEGMPTAIANLAVHKVLDSNSGQKGVGKDGRVCVVREAGQTFGRLAIWELI